LFYTQQIKFLEFLESISLLMDILGDELSDSRYLRDALIFGVNEFLRE